MLNAVATVLMIVLVLPYQRYLRLRILRRLATNISSDQHQQQQGPGGRVIKQYSNGCDRWPSGCRIELQTKVIRRYARFYNHGEGPYQGLVLVGSAY